MTAAADHPVVLEVPIGLAAASPTLFYDSVSYEFPGNATHVMAYADGDYRYDKVKPGEPPLRTKYAHVHDITVIAGAESWRAQFCDYEPGNEAFTLGRGRAWCEARLSRGLRAVIYCDRANLHLLRDELGPVLWAREDLQFWIPTLDGKLWTAAELSWDIAHNWGMYIQASRIMGSQGRDPEQSGGPWDTSVLLGSWN